MNAWSTLIYHSSPRVDFLDDYPSPEAASPYGSFEEPPMFFASEPLTRHSSSEGSSLSAPSPIPDSPLSHSMSFYGGSPVIEPTITQLSFVPDFTLTVDSPCMSPGLSPLPTLFPPLPAEIPRSVMSAESPTTSHCQSSTRDYPLVCLFPNCNAKPFRRRADLERHYRNRHDPDSKRESYWCDYRRCSRKTDPFHRRDHFRDHLRDFHREDIEKRGVPVGEDWYETRYTPHTWWRCNKCLQRITVDEHGFECPTCKAPCHEKRRLIRIRRS